MRGPQARVGRVDKRQDAVPIALLHTRCSSISDAQGQPLLLPAVATSPSAHGEKWSQGSEGSVGRGGPGRARARFSVRTRPRSSWGTDTAVVAARPLRSVKAASWRIVSIVASVPPRAWTCKGHRSSCLCFLVPTQDSPRAGGHPSACMRTRTATCHVPRTPVHGSPSTGMHRAFVLPSCPYRAPYTHAHLPLLPFSKPHTQPTTHTHTQQPPAGGFEPLTLTSCRPHLAAARAVDTRGPCPQLAAPPPPPCPSGWHGGPGRALTSRTAPQ